MKYEFIYLFFQTKQKDESGEVLPNIDFPRVFFLMHKWFMESDTLANMLYDFYAKHESQQTTEKPPSTPNSPQIFQISANYQLKICHAFR